MANYSISQLDAAQAITNNDLFEVSCPDQGSATGFRSMKQSMGAIAEYFGNTVAFPFLLTSDQALVGAINEIVRTASGTGTRNDTYAETGTCAYSQIGRIVIVTLTGCTMTQDAANGSVMFSGLPAPSESTNFIVYGSTSGTTRWYISTTGEMRIGAKALSGQTIVANFVYLAAAAPTPPVTLMMSKGGSGSNLPTLEEIEADEAAAAAHNAKEGSKK